MIVLRRIRNNINYWLFFAWGKSFGLFAPICIQIIWMSLMQEFPVVLYATHTLYIRRSFSPLSLSLSFHTLFTVFFLLYIEIEPFLSPSLKFFQVPRSGQKLRFFQVHKLCLCLSSVSLKLLELSLQDNIWRHKLSLNPRWRHRRWEFLFVSKICCM